VSHGSFSTSLLLADEPMPVFIIALWQAVYNPSDRFRQFSNV
jgi:hypothetical protein